MESDKAGPGATPEMSVEAELARAAQRQAWRVSPERAQTARRTVAALAGLALLGALVGAIVAASSGETETTLGGLYGLGVGLYLGVALVLWIRLGGRREFADRHALERSRARLTEAERVVIDSTGDTSFNALWVATQKRLDYYHEIATGQSQRSFAYGQVAAGTGLIVVLICTILAIVADSASGAVAAGVLGAAGAAMSGYIGSTFLRTQDLAAAQLRAYFGQPLEFSRFLSAERLLDEITDPGRREEAIVALIQAIAQPPQRPDHAPEAP